MTEDFFHVDTERPGWHFWAGALGLHLYWPIWKSHVEWCREWNQL